MDDITGSSPETNPLSNQPCSLTPSKGDNDPGILREKLIHQTLDLKPWISDINLRDDTTFNLKQEVKDLSPSKASIQVPFFKNWKRLIRKVTGKREIEISKIVNVCHCSPEIFLGGHIDLPKAGDAFEGIIVSLAGWVMGKVIQPVAVEFNCNNIRLGESFINLPRPDVSEAHCLTTDFHIWGYRASINLEAASYRGSLQVQAIFPDGSKSSMGYVEFLKY